MARTPKKVTVEAPEVKIPEVEIPKVKEEKPEEKVVEKKEVPEVNLPEIKEAPPVQAKNVKIRVVRNHRCVIGAELYVFEQGKVYTVPEYVKDKLMKAELLDVM